MACRRGRGDGCGDPRAPPRRVRATECPAPRGASRIRLLTRERAGCSFREPPEGKKGFTPSISLCQSAARFRSDGVPPPGGEPKDAREEGRQEARREEDHPQAE